MDQQFAAFAAGILMLGLQGVAGAQSLNQEAESIQAQMRMWVSGKNHSPEFLQNLLQKIVTAPPAMPSTTEMNLTVQAPDAIYVMFDAPNASGNTFPGAINSAGTIIGFSDPGDIYHGFVRYANGPIQTLDVPGGGTGFLQGTIPTALNDLGEIAGNYIDANQISHGFLFVKNILGNGYSQVTFDVNGSIGTYPMAINNLGMIAGTFYDTNYNINGFVRDALGKITIFDIPNSYSLTIAGINDLGTVAGYLNYPASLGFERAPNGTITTFNGPGGNPLLFVNGINLQGEVLGTDQNLNGFIKQSNGKFISFSADGATYPTAINLSGDVIGSNDSSAFLRKSNEAITYFNVPGTLYLMSTSPFGINLFDAITGVVSGFDTTTDEFVFHGFLRISR